MHMMGRCHSSDFMSQLYPIIGYTLEGTSSSSNSIKVHQQHDKGTADKSACQDAVPQEQHTDQPCALICIL